MVRIKILGGPSTLSKILLEENIEIYPSSNKFGAITQFFFLNLFFVDKIKIIMLFFTLKLIQILFMELVEEPV